MKVNGLVLLSLALAAACAPASAGALRPEEVLVVVNANAEGSVALGKYYAIARNVGVDRVLALRCTAEPEVTRAEYNSAIRDPIRAYLRRHDPKGQIRCIVLMWGVPVRVAGPPLTDGQKRLLTLYKARRKRLLARMSVHVKLLNAVGAAYPHPRTLGITPVGALFARDLNAVPGNRPNFSKLRSQFDRVRKRKLVYANALTDKPKRQIALRQLAGVELTDRGMKYLRRTLPREDIAGLPTAKELDKRIKAAQAELRRLPTGKETPEQAGRILELVEQLAGVKGAHELCEGRVKAIDWINRGDAAVDSELPLLWEKDYDINSSLPNPMNWRIRAATTKPADMPSKIIMSCRIDGPRPRDALRIIKDSIAAEKEGLKGTFYVDAGGPYPYYDKHLLEVADIVGKHTNIPVKLDKHKKVFAPGDCPDAALYVGWYSVSKYVPAFTWARGSVGWHVASLEAVHLRAPASNEWCVKMIQNGIAATMGAVNEPFLTAFPLPQDFFALLLTGEYTIADCYWRTAPHTSWRITLIADPLYNPYKLHPQFTTFDLPPALGGRKPRTSVINPRRRGAAGTRGGATEPE